MSIEYITESGSKYSVSWRNLRETYIKFVDMPIDEFANNLPQITHFACIVMWMKERGQYAISDEGIVHELIHLMDDTYDCEDNEIVNKIRNQFIKECDLGFGYETKEINKE